MKRSKPFRGCGSRRARCRRAAKSYLYALALDGSVNGRKNRAVVVGGGVEVLSGADPAFSSDEILGFSETRARHSPVLLVTQCDPVASTLLDLMGRSTTSRGEPPNLGRHARYRRHCQFTFPGLADPSPLRNLLDIAGT